MGDIEGGNVTTLQAKNEIAPPDQKLEWGNGNIKGEVRRSIGSVLRKYPGSMRKDETKGDAKFLSKPYLRETRVEYNGVCSADLPPGLDRGKTTENWVMRQIRTKINYRN